MSSSFDLVSNNFRFHDKIMRACGYFMKSASYKEGFKGSELASKMNSAGSRISEIRETLRLGYEFSSIKGLIETILKRDKMVPLLFKTGLLESIIGMYFFIWDHLNWAKRVSLTNFSKETNEFIENESTNSWLYSTLMMLINRFTKLYVNLKQSKKWKNLSKEEKLKLTKERRTVIFMIIKALVDLFQISYYKNYSFAMRPIFSYFLGVIASFMDLTMILKGGSL